MRLVAAFLIVAAGLFVALVMVPQYRQRQRSEANEAAGVGALVGFWRFDVDATMDAWRTNPRFSKAIARLPSEKIEAMTAKVRNMVSNDPYVQITSDTIISYYKGDPKSMSYVISNVSGNVFTADCITDKGGLSIKMILTVTDDHLEMLNDIVPAGMDLAIILKRMY